MKSITYFLLAALFEIAGCFSFWLWLRQGRSPWILLPGVVSLVLYALCLTRIETVYAGRAYAAYGGIYIVSSLAWLRWIEGVTPDWGDILGSLVCIVGSFIILFVRR